MPRLPHSVPWSFLALALVAAAAAEEPAPSHRAARPGEAHFSRDVIAALSKAGCNQGACHGNLNGKGGLKLSLRGEDPAFDYQSLVRQFEGRRINRHDPEASLILQKPAGRLAHEGGVRFGRDWPEYQILRDWIAAGAPGPSRGTPRLAGLEVSPGEAVLVEPVDEVQLAVTARFADGSRQDVARVACYETSNLNAEVDRAGRVSRRQFGETTLLVRYLHEQVAVRIAFVPARPGFAWNGAAAQNFIDEPVLERLRELRMNPAAVCDDATFLRRASLDLAGVLPTADEARAFVADSAPDKRERLIDRLLARPEFAEFWALKWADVLRAEEKVLDSTGVDRLHGWLRDALAAGQRLDALARDLVTARGSTYENPPANYYRANRDPLTRAETTARLFLGVRLQCARCHNHPFDRWTMDDYYSWAALFARIDYKILENNRRDTRDKNEFVGEQLVLVGGGGGEVAHPKTGRAALPRLLNAANAAVDPRRDRLTQLGEWLTAPENRLFARAQANFIWYHLQGRGLVEPIDDARDTNPPAHPALLDSLAEEFVRRGCDLRQMIRTMVGSRAYQASAALPETPAADDALFARAIVRRLSAEQLLDAQAQFLDLPLEFNGYPRGTRAAQVRGVLRVREREQEPSPDDRFLRTFGKPERLLACECERSQETTLKQALVLIGDRTLNERLADPESRVARVAGSSLSDDAAIAELYWSALGRPPAADELSAARRAVASDRTGGLEDLAWALMSSKEFLFRH